MAIKVIATIEPQVEGAFPVAKAKDVDVDGKRLPEVLGGLAKSSDTYTKEEVDTKISDITVDAYTKAETDSKLNEKANKSDVKDFGLVIQDGMLCVKYESEV